MARSQKAFWGALSLVYAFHQHLQLCSTLPCKYRMRASLGLGRASVPWACTFCVTLQLMGSTHRVTAPHHPSELTMVRSLLTANILSLFRWLRPNDVWYIQSLTETYTHELALIYTRITIKYFARILQWLLRFSIKLIVRDVSCEFCKVKSAGQRNCLL